MIAVNDWFWWWALTYLWGSVATALLYSLGAALGAPPLNWWRNVVLLILWPLAVMMVLISATRHTWRELQR